MSDLSENDLQQELERVQEIAHRRGAYHARLEADAFFTEGTPLHRYREVVDALESSNDASVQLPTLNLVGDDPDPEAREVALAEVLHDAGRSRSLEERDWMDDILAAYQESFDEELRKSILAIANGQLTKHES